MKQVPVLVLAVLGVLCPLFPAPAGETSFTAKPAAAKAGDAAHQVKAAIFSQDGRRAARWPPPIRVLELPLASQLR